MLFYDRSCNYASGTYRKSKVEWLSTDEAQLSTTKSGESGKMRWKDSVGDKLRYNFGRRRAKMEILLSRMRCYFETFVCLILRANVAGGAS